MHLPGELVQLQRPRRFWSSLTPGSDQFYVKDDVVLIIATIEQMSEAYDIVIPWYLVLTQKGLGWTNQGHGLT